MVTLSGHMIIKDGIKYDYPFIESCLSILPICNEFIFLEGYSDDGTYEKLLELQKEHNNIKIIREKWEKRTYHVLADMTNKCIEECRGDYHFQIQADEALPEYYHEQILNLLRTDIFDYFMMGVYHFFSNFETVYRPKVFYDAFVRIAKKKIYPSMRSAEDAMSLGCPDSDSARFRSFNIQHIKMNHYGYVRMPDKLIEKQRNFTKLWGIQELDQFLADGFENGTIDWNQKQGPERLMPFNFAHPECMKKWIEERYHAVRLGFVRNK